MFMAKIEIPKYSLGEEIFNAVSHGVGALLSIAAIVLLIIRSHSAIGVVSGVIYGSIMFILYIISCLYHSLSPRTKGKKVLRVIDHCNVLLMVAGTYTPISLSLIRGALGWTTFGIVWGITILSVVFTAIDVDKYSVLMVLCNLLVGWCGIMLLGPILELCSMKAVWFLISGGIIYSIGAILYACGRHVAYMHSIFHLFVLAGSVFHFFFIFLYCV